MRLHEKGGKEHAMPCHHNLETYLHEYIDGAGLAADPKALLFQTFSRATGQLTGNPLPQPMDDGEARVMNADKKAVGWLGFDGRVFLTKEEHETYCRRLPVRYAAKNLGTKRVICSKCGKPATLENPLQAAHLIPSGAGIMRFWLTPDWLDGPDNLIWAQKRKCNKEAEIPASQIVEYLKQKSGIEVPKHVGSR